MKTFLFYDIETSGLNPAFDQILTFAFIRTDLGLREIDRQTITIRLRRDIVPSPRAFLTHGLTPLELEKGICEYEAALQIHRILNTPDTISLGYNSLGFDDEFLRFLFYRNLLDPYVHQYGNGCSRMDVLPITVVFKVFYPEGLNWPHIDGKPSLKLDRIASENNFVTSGRAHEAMSDVEALIALSKKLYQQKEIWTYCLDFFNKKRDEVRINSIKEEFNIQNRRFRIGLMLSVSFGANVNFMAPVIHLGESLPYKNQRLWLRLDSADIPGLTKEVDLAETFVIRKRPGDALIVLPALERFWERLPDASRELARENMAKIRRDGERFFEFIQHHIAYKYPFIPDMDPDASLYQEGFFSTDEKKQSVQFHKALAGLNPYHGGQDALSRIRSPRIKKMAGRILARNFADQSGPAEPAEYRLCLEKLRSSSEQDPIVGYRNDTKYTCRQGLQEIKEIEAEMRSPRQDQLQMLAWLKTYIRGL